MLAAASSFFGRTNISQSYNIGNPSGNSRTATPTPSGSSATALPVVAHSPPFNVGPWRVQSASHKVTGKRVSVWSADKRSQEMERMGPASKERTLEVLKAEASALGRLRHPSILEMVEPLEETRNELVFATEPVLSSLHLSIPGSFQYSPLVELDEVEIQKGILQLCKGLSFLHSSARIIHTNINPESVLINSAGDWKIGGLGLTIALTSPGGSRTRWEFPTFDGRASPYTQRSFDYIAPEYALDEVLDPASDLYSLGCLIYAVHCKGNPPFKNHGNLSAVREHAGKPLSGMERLDQDLRVLLSSLITRHPQNRPTPSDLPSHAFFSSLPISTLNFLDRANFASKSREEKISFMKGLTSVLDKFSEGLRIRKILPTLLEEMKDTQLLPYILPNIFAISHILSSAQFASLVLPSLKPLFAVKDPPQNMLTLLDNLQILQDKTEKPVFREHVLPLVYNAMESEHAPVQERALKAVPSLCETIDYAEVQGVLFPRVALVFTKTRMLSVKIATLVTFLAMVKTLDQTSLTQKLVPLLSKIRTKEPAVMMATLAVQEAMGLKVDREAVATLVLPQLWAMSIGPLISVAQFRRFMEVIRKLSERVEKEHEQYLRDNQRLEDRSSVAVNGGALPPVHGIDFESLVGSSQGAAVKADTVIDESKGWDDDVWGSIFTNGTGSPPAQSPATSPAVQAISPPQKQPQSFPTSPRMSQSSQSSSSRPNSIRMSSNHLSSSTSASSSLRNSVLTPSSDYNTILSTQPRMSQSISSQSSFMTPMQPASSSIPASATHAPTSTIQSSTSAFHTPISTAQAPNYNISLTPAQPHPISPPMFAPPGMGTLLTPSQPAQPQWPSTNTTTKTLSKTDWGDFDPLA